MQDGSFLVFRKLEQNVKAFRELIQVPFDNLTSTGVNAANVGCTKAPQLGAKLMGRWPSGRPVVSNTGDTDMEMKIDEEQENNFEFKDNSVCPLAAHIRKTNPRDGKDLTLQARIVRGGIPYGPDFDPTSTTNDTRGLLFACYQSSIERGYQFIQSSWANNAGIPFNPFKSIAGFDAFMGQQASGSHTVNLFKNAADTKGTPITLPTRLVTMRGGEYFFVPPIAALKLKGALAGS